MGANPILASKFCRGAGIGLQDGLKIRWVNNPCGFESHPRHSNMDPLKDFKEAQKAVKEKMLTLILAGFGLIAALAWNDAIQTLFNTLFPNSNGLIGKFIYALIITCIVVVISLQLKKISEKKE